MTKLLNARPCPHCGQALFIMNTQPKEKEIRWVYKRKSLGDVETHASSKKDAILIFRQYGFSDANESTVTTGRSKIPVPTSVDFERIE